MLLHAPITLLANHVRFTDAQAGSVVTSSSTEFVAKTRLAVLAFHSVSKVSWCAQSAGFAESVVQTAQTFSCGRFARLRVSRIDVA